MLSTEQKAVILRKAGIQVPAFPLRRSPLQEGDQGGEAPASHRQLVAAQEDGGDCEGEEEAASDAWIEAVDKLYADYALARAAWSLQDAERARSGGTA